MAGEFSGVFDNQLQSLVWASGSGVAMVLRAAGLALIVIGLSLPGRRKISVNVSGIAAFFTRPRPRLFPSGIGVAAVLLGFTFVGHTASSPYSSTLEALLLMHLVMAAFWFGSLWPLLITSRRESSGVAGEVVELFSAIAIWLVPVLALAGLGLAVAILKSIDGLWTDYGRLLLLKVAGVCVVLILAATNKWRHGPRLSHGNPQFTEKFCRTLVAEYFLIAGILCLTAVLTALYSPDM
jgi:putative copper resistance protein D